MFGQVGSSMAHAVKHVMSKYRERCRVMFHHCDGNCADCSCSANSVEGMGKYNTGVYEEGFDFYRNAQVGVHNIGEYADDELHSYGWYDMSNSSTSKINSHLANESDWHVQLTYVGGLLDPNYSGSSEDEDQVKTRGSLYVHIDRVWNELRSTDTE